MSIMRRAGILIIVALAFCNAPRMTAAANNHTGAGVTQAPAALPESTADFKVTLLGTGTHGPRPDRFGASTLVEAGPERLVFDCGRSCTTRLWQLGIPLGTVKLFITHLHADHTVGIPDLWLTGWLPMPYGGRREPFRVWGPKGTEEMMADLQKAYRSNIQTPRSFTLSQPLVGPGGNVRSERMLVGIVSVILPPKQNGLVNEKASNALFEGAFRRLNARFVDLARAVNHEAREDIQPWKEQRSVRDREQKLFERPVDAARAIIYFWATGRYRK